MRMKLFVVAGLLAIGCSETRVPPDPGPGVMITPPPTPPEPTSGGTIIPPSATFNFTGLAVTPPAGTSLSARVGSTLGHDLVTITGTGFDPSTQVAFGGIVAEIKSQSANQIVAYTPANPGAWGVPVVVSVRRPNQNVQLVNDNTANSQTSFRYYASSLDFRQRDFWNVNSGAFRGYRFGLWGDVNNDGRPDMVITYANTANYSTWLNTGGGNLNNVENTNWGPNNPASFWSRMTNLDNDGVPDIITVDEGSTWDYHLGTSNVNFNSRGSQGSGATCNGRSVDLALVNNDAYNDMILGCFNQNYVGLYINQFPTNSNVNAIFPTSPTQNLNTPGAQPYHAVFTDLNKDGKMDVVAFNSNSSAAAVWWFTQANNALPSAASGSVGTNVANQQVFVGNCADFNNDGYSDCATSDYGTNTVRIFMNDGTGNLLNTDAAHTIPVGVNPRGLIFDDINGDGNVDLLVTNYSSHNFTVVPGRGNGTFGIITDAAGRVLAAPVNIAFNACKYGWSLSTVDVDGDGVREVSVTCQMWTNDDSYLGGVLVYKNVSR